MYKKLYCDQVTGCHCCYWPSVSVSLEIGRPSSAARLGVSSERYLQIGERGTSLSIVNHDRCLCTYLITRGTATTTFKVYF